MSVLSKEIARWIQMHPGPIYGLSDAEVWATAQKQFIADRRWKDEVPMDKFMIHVANLGYRTETRDNTAFEEGKSDQRTPRHFVMLALPEGSRGF